MNITVLGIETSCDETAAAIVRGRPGAHADILSNQVLSQIDEHAPYAGVVPEIAARAHIDHLDGLVARTLDEAGLGLGDLDGIAATAGPGLIGGVMVGLMTAKALALSANKPLIGVNHLEGHALTARLTENLGFPYLLLLVSGGHCQILKVEGLGAYTLLGTTIDDAVGEAFDKVAKMLGLGFPGGPSVERWATQGDPDRFDLPRPLADRPGLDFSFSGLKTAVRREAEKLGGPAAMSDRDIADLCASFQRTVADILSHRIDRALDQNAPGLPLVVAGGVAANQSLRGALSEVAQAHGSPLIAPPMALCTDNAAMIAWAGLERLAAGRTDPLDIKARARWPLAELT